MTGRVERSLCGPRARGAVGLAAGASLAWLVGLEVSRTRRLHRLHVRVESARAGLNAALDRRADVALVAVDVVTSAALPAPEPPSGELPMTDPVAGAVPRDLAHRVPTSHTVDGVRGAPTVCDLRHAGSRGDREAAENAVGRLLARLDPGVLPLGLRAELREAELGVALARRLYNDAVRDTLGLRARRTVRWLHLAGTAPLPAYFEIADGPLTPTGPCDDHRSR